MSRRKTHEEFVAEVKALVGDEYTVESEYLGARAYVGIRHNKCAETYPVMPTKFLQGTRCPKCAGNKNKTTEEYKSQVFKLVKGEYKVVGEYVNCRTKIDMQHRTCNEVYPVTPRNFLDGKRCPKCQESKGEKAVAEWLNGLCISHESQKPIRYAKGKRPLKLDFFIQGVAIEFDGEYHYMPMPHAGGEKGLREVQRRDRIKDKYCADNGIPLIRIPYWDFDNIDAILTEKLLPLLDASVTQKKAS